MIMNIHLSDYAKNNFHVMRNGDTLEVTVTYPPESCGQIDDKKVTYVLVDQEAVRASGGVRVHFDYARDGFVIEQRTNWEGVPINKDGTFDEDKPEYVEVAFARAFHPTSKGLNF